MFEFSIMVSLWLQSSNDKCAVIHCKGGKGRTGMMVTAFILYDYRETNEFEALEYFAKMRTDLTKKGSLQKVSSPSQLRYVKYFYLLIHIADMLTYDELLEQTNSVNPNDAPKFHLDPSNSSKKPLASLSPNDSDQPSSTRVIDKKHRRNLSSQLSYLDQQDLNITGLKKKKSSKEYSKSVEMTSLTKHNGIKLVGIQEQARESFSNSNESVIENKSQLYADIENNDWGNSLPGTPKTSISSNVTFKHLTQNLNTNSNTFVKNKNPKFVRGTWETNNSDLKEVLLLNKELINGTFKVPTPNKNRMSYDSNIIDNSSNLSGHNGANKPGKDNNMVAINTLESKLCESYLKQKVYIKLILIKIGPIKNDWWNNDNIFFNVNITTRKDFVLKNNTEFHELKYSTKSNTQRMITFYYGHNNDNSWKYLNLTGNIGIDIVKCQKIKKITNNKGSSSSVEVIDRHIIGSVWIHSHFLPANYSNDKFEILFDKSEIDGMYKDINHTKYNDDFSISIGYISLRNND